MPGRSNLEQRLRVVEALRQDPHSEATRVKLRNALRSKVSHLVAKAARLCGECEVRTLNPELTQAFGRFLVAPATSDKTCAAKTAIAESLYRLGYDDAAIFLQGIRHVQLEPVWGGKEDTAAELRGVCAMALAQLNYSRVMVELADLLADPMGRAREVAARTIAYYERRDCVPLLRLRVLSDEPETTILPSGVTATPLTESV